MSENKVQESKEREHEEWQRKNDAENADAKIARERFVDFRDALDEIQEHHSQYALCDRLALKFRQGARLNPQWYAEILKAAAAVDLVPDIQVRRTHSFNDGNANVGPDNHTTVTLLLDFYVGPDQFGIVVTTQWGHHAPPSSAPNGARSMRRTVQKSSDSMAALLRCWRSVGDQRRLPNWRAPLRDPDRRRLGSVPAA